MVHEAKDFSALIGTLKGLSDKQLSAHLGLYKGYVAKLNEIEGRLREAEPTSANYSFGEFSELKRREAVAFNGTYLHQLYFENLSAAGGLPSERLQEAVKSSFGSWDRLVADLKGSAVSTPGWVLLTRSRIDGRLHTYVMYEHHVGLPAFQDILLALDCWEHAFMIDYGTAKADYLKAFLDNVDWGVVDARYGATVPHTAS